MRISGSAFKLRRESCGISSRDVEDFLGFSRGYISTFENKNIKPSSDRVDILVDFYENMEEYTEWILSGQYGEVKELEGIEFSMPSYKDVEGWSVGDYAKRKSDACIMGEVVQIDQRDNYVYVRKDAISFPLMLHPAYYDRIEKKDIDIYISYLRRDIETFLEDFMENDYE